MKNRIINQDLWRKKICGYAQNAEGSLKEPIKDTTVETVLEYIDSQPSETHSHLKELMTAIRDNVPYVHECIKWSMPYYKKGEKSISFAAFKKHVSFYVGAEVIEEFSSELTKFVTKKDAIYLPYNKEFPTQVIIDIAKRCLN